MSKGCAAVVSSWPRRIEHSLHGMGAKRSGGGASDERMPALKMNRAVEAL